MPEVNKPTNPVVRIGSSPSSRGNPDIIRNFFSRIVFGEQNFRNYSSGLDATNITQLQREHDFFFRRFEDVSSEKPSQVSDEAWSSSGEQIGLKDSSSGFITPQSSVMPKLFIPSVSSLLDNGNLLDQNDASFNWEIFERFTGVSSTDERTQDEKFIPKEYGNQSNVKPRFFSLIGKDDLKNETVNMKLEGTDVVGGAFVLMLNIIPHRMGKIAPDKQIPWNIVITFGEVIIQLSENGLIVDVGGTKTRVQLSDARSKETPEQFAKLKDGNPYVLVVYPVWNGIVISNGIQDLPNTVKVSSTFCPKDQNANIIDDIFNSGFTAKDPIPVEIAPKTVDMGSELMNLSATNIKANIVYSPCFFAGGFAFDDLFEGRISGTSPGQPTFTYTAYALYTQNLGVLDLADSKTPLTGQNKTEDSEIRYFDWSADAEVARHAGELFGYIFVTTQSSKANRRNSSGNFAGLPGNWTKYIESINVQIGLDGSNGTIVVDKYGVTDGDMLAIAPQSVGSIAIQVSAGFGDSGEIFNGLAWGVGDSVSADSGGWTVTLVGLEKKLTDMVLINTPFFDGEDAMVAITYLCDYAGIGFDGTIPGVLPTSQDVQSPFVDFKAGTTVLDALTQIMGWTFATFTIWGGKIHFYPLATGGLPIRLGRDWKPRYPKTLTVSQDFTPNLDELRNEIMIFSMRRGDGGTLESQNLLPQIELVQNDTNPQIPWSKPLIEGHNGFLSPEELSRIIELRKADAGLYDGTGTTTIPGNAAIKPYDRWGNQIITSVSHTVDIQGKNWTTQLSLGGGG